ncbi:MAG: carboxymuconolactone decarboxylase family protein [Sphingomonadaceae bacterium]
MAIFPSLSDDPQLGELFKRFPRTVPPLLDYHDRLLRDRSPLTVATRELIAAYVSGLNACDYCHGAHIIAARNFGVDEELFGKLLADIDSAPVEDRLKPILRYVRKLTLTPSRIAPSDAEAVYAAGWDEEALFDAVSVAALFNMMNRIVMGAGILHDPLADTSGDRAARASRMGEAGEDPHSASPSYARLARAYGIGGE